VILEIRVKKNTRRKDYHPIARRMKSWIFVSYFGFAHQLERTIRVRASRQVFLRKKNIFL